MQTQESFNRNLIISYKNLIGDLIYKSYKMLIRRPFRKHFKRRL